MGEEVMQVAPSFGESVLGFAEVGEKLPQTTDSTNVQFDKRERDAYNRKQTAQDFSTIVAMTSVFAERSLIPIITERNCTIRGIPAVANQSK